MFEPGPRRRSPLDAAPLPSPVEAMEKHPIEDRALRMTRSDSGMILFAGMALFDQTPRLGKLASGENPA